MLIIAESGLTSMFADPFSSREADFSHLYLRVFHGSLPDAGPVHRSSFRSVLIGYVVSIALHVLVLAFYWKHDSQQRGQYVSPPLTIQLTLKPHEITPIASPEVAQPVKNTPEVYESAQTNTSTKAESQAPDKPKAPDEPKVKPIVIQPLAMDELRELTHQKDAAIDSQATGIAANVFNPTLRKRLHEEASKPELQRVDAGPKTYTDPSGATIVDLGGGKCLRSSAPKPGEVQNWYMTSCGGKSESEQIIERINQAVNGKLEFD